MIQTTQNENFAKFVQLIVCWFIITESPEKIDNSYSTDRASELHNIKRAHVHPGLACMMKRLSACTIVITAVKTAYWMLQSSFLFINTIVNPCKITIV